MNLSVTLIGIVGAVSGAFSAYWWYRSSRVPPVYNTAMLGGNPEEKARTDLAASLNAKAAIAAAIAVAAQSILLAMQTLPTSK